jgi:hypothetical protein
VIQPLRERLENDSKGEMILGGKVPQLAQRWCISAEFPALNDFIRDVSGLCGGFNRHFGAVPRPN